MRVLLKFSRGEEIKYISHLDLQRLFKRALRRANIAMEYSKGFNPRILISFATALPLGTISNCEYVEIETEKYYNPIDVKNHLNQVLPQSIRIVSAIEPDDKFPNVGSVIALASYSLYAEDFDKNIISDIISREEIIVEKRTKKGLANVNVRPMIHSLSFEGNVIKATLSCSNSENLRADKLAEILKAEGIEITTICREDIFIIKDGILCRPIEEK